jgi:hypothetical protein
MIHGTSHEEYRDRYGLPWRRGLVSTDLSDHLSERITRRIEDGSFIPKPNSKAARESTRAGHRRNDQPFVTGRKSELTRGVSRKKVKYSRTDYENVLSAMLEPKVALRQACMDENLPPASRVLEYAASNPGFRKRSWKPIMPSLTLFQARADMFSPQFYRDLKRLKGKGLYHKEIAERLGISNKSVSKRLRQMV